ncbi:MAG: hypothetical protein AAFQ45_01530 [Pseudomonadota bacterium]
MKLADTSLALALGAVVIAVGGLAAVPRAGGGPFDTLTLGMTHAAALTEIRKRDRNAFPGPVCDGAYGIAAYIKHLGRTWRLLAHSDASTVDKFIVERSSRRGMASVTACAQFYADTVTRHYRARHARASWRTTGARTGDALDIRTTAVVDPSTRLTVAVERAAKDRALCTVRITYELIKPF